MWNSITNTDKWEGDIWNRSKNGEIFPQHLIITAVKDYNGAVTNYVATFIDITERQQAADAIEQLAFYDPLTGLPNRRLLIDRLKHSLAAGARNGSSGALLFLDLDHFKTLNDSLGHAVGDQLLQQVAQRLTDSLRKSDTIARLARLGGDEFVILLEGLKKHDIEAAAQAKVVGEKILLNLKLPYKLGTHNYQSTVSVGVVIFSGQNLLYQELLKRADIAMYQAKKAGRNTMCFFDPQMQDVIHARIDLERELRKALDNQQFQLHYQIQVDDSGSPLGAEALIRWLHPERGLVSPFHFIPLAEETGLILPIGQWVLDTACAQLKAWERNKITRNLSISINISAKQFRQTDFVTQVKTAVRHHAIIPNRLKLELTESILLENIEEAVTTMNTLKEIGVWFSLDDFGTGYSSLQYLKRLPLHQLKIDQSFVRDIVADSSDKAIVCTIIAMAQSMDLEVIAEGVETEAQQTFLHKNGCMHYQGYLFGKPMPIEQFEAALKQG
jgi:diguanylate cyclase (GGDEF)-like protein